MRRRTTNSRLPFPPARHLFSRPGHPTIRSLFPVVAVVVAAALFACAAQAIRNPDNQKEKKAPEDFLVFCSVYNEQGYSFPGAEISVRRAGEKKVRWQGGSDRRGEYAVHVPLGVEYEVSVNARGYAGQSRKVDARQGDRENLTFRMQPAPEGKKK